MLILMERTKTPWGCTIYRTTYTPLSEAHFPEIIELINVLIKENVHKYDNFKPNDAEKRSAKPTLLESYEPIVTNNKSEFDGMTLDAIRAQKQSFVEIPEGERLFKNEWFCVLIVEEVVQTSAGADPAALLATRTFGTMAESIG
ncbi:hypothetical protein BDV12DRAFT_205139 [Aspergillus spectabilis]